MTKKFNWQIAANIFIFAATLIGFYLMYFRSEGLLQDKGITAFKYFTVQSNVFGGAAAAVWLISAIWSKGKEVPRIVSLLKFTAAICLGLTFITVMVFLGPLYGYIAMLRKANFFFHLIIPLAAMSEFVFLNRHEISLKNCLAATLPMFVYAACYLTNILVNGGTRHSLQYDWYSILRWGWGVGVCIFAVICVVTFGIAALLRKLNCILHKKYKNTVLQIQ